ncbi:alcohol acetyltransferase-domain-containing protein [Rhizophagus clarus]|uniref:Alcohol acetyltransferase-domain-containing protein n=1 Tax=Rhizophagus clarus TaxID=94130 RepID=A0A8H3QW33_9GLOM|nr:alcohol acetyltransferase-domain-containing protein [Rhizophagus clarus]
MRQNVNFYNNILFSVRYKWDELYNLNPIIDPITNNIINKAKEFILQILYPSLKKLILKQPSLSISLKDSKSSQPLFILLSQIDLFNLVKFIVISNDEKDLVNVFEREHDIALDQEDETKPLWRITVGIYNATNLDMRPNYDLCVIFCWNHCIGDGRSAYAIHNAFIESVNSTLQEKNNSFIEPINSSSKYIISIPDTQICEPLERRINVKPTILHLLKEVFIEFLLPSTLKKSLLPNYWAGDIHSKDLSDYHTKVQLYSIEKDEFENLMLITKQNQTTIQAVLHTAILFSSSHYLSNNNKSIRVTSPLTLRPYAVPPISSNDMGNYVAEFLFDYEFPINKSNFDDIYFWELCHQYKSQLKNNIPSSIQHVGMLDYLSKDNKSWEDFFKQKMFGLPMGRGYSIELSNLGKYNEENNNVCNWEIVDMFFSQSAQVVGAAINVNSISYNNKLNISITYQKGAISNEKVKEFSNGTFLDADFDFEGICLDA